jgi:hypothetical protein
MPQLSLYIDEETLRKLETAARLENLSLSKYVVQKLNESMNTSWPHNYEKLFGSIVDETFETDRPDDFAHDSSREQL